MSPEIAALANQESDENIPDDICPECFSDLDQDRYCSECHWFPLAVRCDSCGGWTHECCNICPGCLEEGNG